MPRVACPAPAGARPRTWRSALTRARPLVWGAVAVAAAVFGIRDGKAVIGAAGLLGHVRAAPLGVAAAAEAVSLSGFGLLQHRLLRCSGARLARSRVVEVTLAGSALSKVVPGGAAVAGVWAYGQLRRRGAGRAAALWTLLVAGALSSFALFVVVAVGVEAAGGRGPLTPLRWPAAVLAAVPVGAGLLGFGWRHRPGRRARVGHVVSPLPASGTLRRRPATVVKGVWSQLRRVRPGPRGWMAAFGWALVNWVGDALVLVVAIVALGGSVPWRGIVVSYGLAQIAGSVPVTPGGVGVVEGTLAGLLVAYGMPGSTALAAAVLYRMTGLFVIAAVGGAAWAHLRLTRGPAAEPPDMATSSPHSAHHREPPDDGSGPVWAPGPGPVDGPAEGPVEAARGPCSGWVPVAS